MRSELFYATMLFFVLLVIIVCSAWGDWAFGVVRSVGTEGKNYSLGDWGDSFGALNAAFSGLAFVGLGSTIYLQRIAMRKAEQERGKVEFESQFFQIFGLIRELRRDIEYLPVKQRTMAAKSTSVGAIGTKQLPGARRIVVKGQKGINKAYSDVRKIFRTRPIASTEELVRIYGVVVNRHNESDFGPYFRSIYTALKRIDQCVYLSEDEKLNYSRLLRSQMDSWEVGMLGINALTDQSKDLKKYVEAYRMLKYCRDDEISTILKECFCSSTFVGR